MLKLARDFLSILLYRKGDIIAIVDNYISPAVGDSNYLIDEEFTTDSSSCSDNDTSSGEVGRLPIPSPRRPGGGSSPGEKCGRYIIGKLIKHHDVLFERMFEVFDFLESNVFTPTRCAIIKDMFNCYIEYGFWLIVPTACLIHTFFVFIDVVYTIELEFNMPSHAFFKSDFLQNANQRFITFNDFLMKHASRYWIFRPLLRRSPFMRGKIRTFRRLKRLRNVLGLVCVNRLNLVLDTVHNSYAGAGLKSLLIHDYSSILVHIVTNGYSRLEMRRKYAVFYILVIGGIGAVVWYKFVNCNCHPMPIEPYDWFKNPTAVVEGYKRVTFWIQKDLEFYVKNAYTFEKPFNEILNLHEFWNSTERSRFDQDQVESVGIAIMTAIFIATNVLIPLGSDVQIPQPTPMW